MASENNNRLDDALAKAIGCEKREPDFAKWQQDHPEAMQMLKSQATRQARSRRLLDIGRIIMRSPMSKLAAAAIIIVAVVVSISVFNKSMPTAFGIEQVIAASDNIRFLHAKQYRPNQGKPNEFWIKSDEQGRVVKARYYLPVTDDGVKLITWSPEGTELWFQSKHWLALIQTKRIAGWMQSIMEQCQPKLVMEKLLEDQKAGKVDIDIQKPAVIVATYKTESKKEIYYVNQKTDLITHVESYRIEGDHEVLKLTTQFSEYNIPIDEKMFSLRDEVPKDVRIADRLNQICGVAQGDMTDEQAAAETIRQYLQALIDKDYKKAGLICCGMLEEYAKKDFGWCDVNAILSIGPPIPQPEWRKHGFQVPFELEIVTSDGRKAAYKFSQYVSPEDDEMHPDRWNITSGGLERTGKELKVLPDNKKYEKMTPKEAAEAFFKACSEKNWDEVLKFWTASRIDERLKEYVGGLEIISIGEPFKSGLYPGWFVPYEIRLQSQEFNVRVSNANPANRFVITGTFDSKMKLQEETKWSSEPNILPDNDVYAKMSPQEVVKKYFEAFSKLDFNEMQKFEPDSAVKAMKGEFEEAKKYGMDVKEQIPTVEVGEAFWSAEQSAYFVKCHVSGVKKFNLAVRNDNPAKRWVVDGGL
jgi:hypothetical protein